MGLGFSRLSVSCLRCGVQYSLGEGYRSGTCGCCDSLAINEFMLRSNEMQMSNMMNPNAAGRPGEVGRRGTCHLANRLCALFKYSSNLNSFHLRAVSQSPMVRRGP